MRILDPIRNNPVATLCVVVAGVIGWVGANLLRGDSDAAVHDLADFRPVGPGGPLPGMPRRHLPPPELASEHQQIPSEVLPRLKAGMTRVEIEEILGPPAASSLQPVSLADGRTTYQTAYELADPDPPATVRPIRRVPTPRDPVQPKSVVALEFDASKPGHPLINVLYLDPLF